MLGTHHGLSSSRDPLSTQVTRAASEATERGTRQRREPLVTRTIEALRKRSRSQKTGYGKEDDPVSGSVDNQLEVLMAKDHGPSVKDDKQYAGLRKKGMSKSRAAAIANSPGSSSRGGKQRGSGDGSSQSRKSSDSGSGGNKAQKAAAGRKGGKKASS